MKSAPPIFRTGLVVIAILLAASLGIWIFGLRRSTDRSDEAPGPTLDEAAAGAAPAVRAIRPLLAPAPEAPLPEAPVLHLKAGRLHPRPAPGPDAALEHARPSERGYPWMVAFDGPVQTEWRLELEAAGATLRAYLPDHAWLVEAPLDRREAIRRLPHVEWMGEYRPALKVQPLLAALSRQHPGLPVPITLQTFSPGDVAGLERELAAAGASDIRTAQGRRWGLLRAVLPARAAVELAQQPEVQWVEHHEPARLLNDAARDADRLNADIVRETYGLDGSGQIVAIADTGLDSGDTNTLHPDFAGRLLHVFDIGRLTNWSDTYYHGTHVAASVLGSGAASGGQYRGVAPGAGLVVQSVMTAGGSLALPDDLNDLYRPPHELGARIHSDSWGSAVFGEYTSDSMTTDEFLWDHPDMLIAFAAGNEGEDLDRNGVIDPVSLNAPATAKNVLTVGASESGRPPGGGGKTSATYGGTWGYSYRVPPISTDYISSSPEGAPQGIVAFSSRGPTVDGRIKPDVVAPGTDVVSARSRASASTGWGVLPGNTNYCFMGGTSMSTPLAAGAAALVRQFAVDLRGIENPSGALIKAALAGGARSLAPGQYGTGEFREIPEGPRPNSVEGWGQIDLGETLFPDEGLQSILMEGPAALYTGGSHSMSFLAATGAPLTVVMAYSDYPSSLAAAVNLVNDLDLELLDPDGVLHHPNGLDGPDDRNNIEGIDVAGPVPGVWTLTVSARNVPEGPQPFALYLRGTILTPVEIDHEPLDNTFVTNAGYFVSADITSAGAFDPDTAQVRWIASGSTSGFAAVAMTTTNGTRFEASIPPQPVGTRIWYFLKAGPPEFPGYHPPDAPMDLHSFDITPALTLTVSGSPSNSMSADPDYGVHLLASNVSLRARAVYPPLGTNGWRTACIGWTGTGSVPPSGDLDFCDFTLTQNSSITWLWQDQVALAHTSTPYGALAAATWHPLGGTATSLIAPESHVFNNVPLTFAGWQIDGARFPAGTAPSRRQISGIPMPAPRTATATYLATDLDSDANGLPDWFELRYYGQLGRDRYADADGDGYEDELEAADHTDPLDAASFPTPPVIVHGPLASPSATPAPWPVTATITDNYRVAGATLHWQRNGGVWRSAAMTNTGGTSLYTGNIPSPVRDGDQVVYFLSATDPAGFLAQSSAWTVTVSYARMAVDPDFLEASLPAATRSNLNLFIWNNGSQPLEVSLEIAHLGFIDDVETGTNGWTRPDGNVDWHISSQEANSPLHAWYCGQATTRTYRDSTHAALVSPPIQLGASPRLDFMHRARFEPDQDVFPDGVHYWDSGVIEITDNEGQLWQSLVPEGGYPGLITSNPASPFAPDTPCFVDTDEWEPVGTDLAAFAGRTVQIRFRFGADRYVVAEGWRIDDIVVSPLTEYDGWLALPATNPPVPVGLGMIFPLAVDTAPLPPMASGHLAVRIHHNDPEQASPVVIPVALHNTTRRARVTTAGPGDATPPGEHLLQAGEPFSVVFAADPGHFIADMQSTLATLPLTTVWTQMTVAWPELPGNLELHAVFAPQLEEGSVSTDWLAQYGLTNRHWMAEASLDQDGDGLLTWQEEELGSSPIDPADAPLVIRIHRPPVPGGDWHVSWHAFTNLDTSYSILSTTNPVHEFPVFTNLPPAPPVMTSPPLPALHRFFGLQRH